MEDCKEELHSLLQENRLAGATLLVLANKQDLAGAMTDGEIREALSLRSIVTHNWRIMPCSAVTGKNVHEALEWVVADVAGRIYYNAQ